MGPVALDFVPGFCVKDVNGMQGLASWSTGETPSLRISLGSEAFGTFCGGGGVLFPASRLPLKEGFQSRGLGMRDWKTDPVCL